MSKSLDYFIWMEKYRPHSVNDMLLPIKLKKYFQKAITIDKQISNIILYSTNPGSGKCLFEDSEIEIEIDESIYNKYKELFNN
jgi:hypothetical protein